MLKNAFQFKIAKLRLIKRNKIMSNLKHLTVRLITVFALATTSIENLAQDTSTYDQPNAVQLVEGSSGEARALSAKHNLLVLHVSGGTQDKYSAEQYAKMFQIMFNDPERTRYTTKISVIYEESGDDLPTGVYAFINGQTFDKNGGIYVTGDGVFTAPEIVKWIPKITKEYSNRLASLK